MSSVAKHLKKVVVTSTKPEEPIVIPGFDTGGLTYNPSETYPEVVLGRGITGQLTWVTPDLAQRWFDNNKRTQRNRKKHHLDSMIDDVRNGRFVFTGQPIIFDKNGDIVDGQHRLFVIMKTEIPLLLLVIRNIDPNAYYAMDNTAKRQLSDVLRTDGHENVIALSCAIRLLNRYEHGRLIGMGSSDYTVVSTIAGREIIDRYPGLEESVRATSKAGRICGSWGSVAFCHFVLLQKDPDDTRVFFNKLGTGEDLSDGNPILTLRSKFVSDKDKYRNDEVIFFVFKAWNKWRSGEKVYQLKKGSTENLPIPI